MNPENLIEQENSLTKHYFNLDEILEFQLKNDVQIIRGGDFMYQCYINKDVYEISFTPIHALVFGIKRFKKEEK